MVLEIALLLLLIFAGWNGTGLVIGGFAAILPIIVGLAFMFYRGRKFSLRSLLLATACFAGFIAITLQPLLNAQRARRTTIALTAAGARIHQPYEVGIYYRLFDRIDNSLSLEFPNSDSEFPVWIQPFAGDLPKTPRNDSVTFVSVGSDEQLKTVCDSANDLSNLRMLMLNGISPKGFRYFANHYAKFEKLDSIIVMNSVMADDCIHKFERCWLFMYVIGAGNGRLIIPNPTQVQFSELARLPKLEHLQLAIPIEDSELKLLSGSKSLKSLRIYNGLLTPEAIESFERENPNCKILTD